MTVRLITMAIAIFVPMGIEAAIAARHDRALRASGSVEPRDDVYRLMQVAYPAAFLAMIAEGWIRGGESETLLAGIIVFLVAKALKYWAIATLGPRWTFRVLVPPGSSRTVSGPYRVVRHPNYVAVIGELAAVGLMTGARISGPVGTGVFLVLILARIRVEERALGAR